MVFRHGAAGGRTIMELMTLAQKREATVGIVESVNALRAVKNMPAVDITGARQFIFLCPDRFPEEYLMALLQLITQCLKAAEPSRIALVGWKRKAQQLLDVIILGTDETGTYGFVKALPTDPLEAVLDFLLDPKEADPQK